MKNISYKKIDELEFVLENEFYGYSIFVTYEKDINNNQIGFNVSFWISDNGEHFVGYKKYIFGEYIRGTYKTVKTDIKNKVIYLLQQEEKLHQYIKEYEKEINHIGNMYI